jgi:hypothetical protein
MMMLSKASARIRVMGKDCVLVERMESGLFNRYRWFRESI